MKFWNYNLSFLPENSFFEGLGINVEKYSDLAKSVYYANHNLTKKLKKDDLVLEIGCGSDSIIYNSHKNWLGIDVVDSDRDDKPTLATNIASVHSMPFKNNKFDYILSNQSIEHWYEYGITFDCAFKEINRVLKKNAFFIFNFPIHLHGHKFFVLNKLETINDLLIKNGFIIEKRTAFVGQNKYEGWIKCGFPTIYLNLFSKKFERTSFVVEYEVKKVNHLKNFKTKSFEIPKRKSRYLLRLHHGLLVVLYNIVKKIKL